MIDTLVIIVNVKMSLIFVGNITQDLDGYYTHLELSSASYDRFSAVYECECHSAEQTMFLHHAH